MFGMEQFSVNAKYFTVSFPYKGSDIVNTLWDWIKSSNKHLNSSFVKQQVYWQAQANYRYYGYIVKAEGIKQFEGIQAV